MKRVIILWTLLLVSGLYGVDSPRIEQIQAYPYSYLRDPVKLEGKVIKYNMEKMKSSKCYMFQDNYGDTIKVITIQNLPEVDQRYEITGVVTIVDIENNNNNKEVNIIESERKPLGQVKPIGTETSTISPGEKTGGSGGLVNALFGIAAFLLVVIAVIIIFLIFNRNSKKQTSVSLSTDSGGYGDPETDQVTVPLEPSSETIENTILKMIINSEKTMEILPGRFEFIKGSEVINNIRFYRDLAKKETEFLFGRKPRQDLDYIQLKSLTVSEKHAKLRWDNNKYMLINYSTTNPTKVNGNRMGKDVSADLKYGDTIEMGDIIIKMHQL